MSATRQLTLGKHTEKVKHAVLFRLRPVASKTKGSSMLSALLILYLPVKKLNTPEYRHYLKLWNEETKPKQENTKDLPKLNQVRCGLLSGVIHSVSERNSVQ